MRKSSASVNRRDSLSLISSLYMRLGVRVPVLERLYTERQGVAHLERCLDGVAIRERERFLDGVAHWLIDLRRARVIGEEPRTSSLRKVLVGRLGVLIMKFLVLICDLPGIILGGYKDNIRNFVY